MLRKITLLVPLYLVLSVTTATAQTSTPKLGLIFKNIFGPNGLTVDSEAQLPSGETHSAHFNGAFQTTFQPFNTALASQLTAVPLPSPAASFTYTYNEASGAFVRSTQSFGPILADRSETIGRQKFSASFNYQRFSFDSIEGINLDSVPAVFTHDNPDSGGRLDIVTTTNNIRATVGQFTSSFNYGITNRLDFSVAVPIVKTSISLTSDATIQRLGTTDPKVHFFGPAGGPYGNTKRFKSEGSKTGLGDLIFRLKGSALKGEHMGLALGADFRAPTGDEENLLGSGAPGLKPFAAFSFTHKSIAPHVNVGYQMNGKSVLAGDISAKTKGRLPDQFLYTVGVDVGATSKLTLAFDMLGERIIDSHELVQYDGSYKAEVGTSPRTFSNIRFDDNKSFNVINGAAGVKYNPIPHVLIGFNLLFKMNDSGLRDKVTPLIGFEYSR